MQRQQQQHQQHSTITVGRQSSIYGNFAWQDSQITTKRIQPGYTGAREGQSNQETLQQDHSKHSKITTITAALQQHQPPTCLCWCRCRNSTTVQQKEQEFWSLNQNRSTTASRAHLFALVPLPLLSLQCQKFFTAVLLRPGSSSLAMAARSSKQQ
jgi:hypothetical protein